MSGLGFLPCRVCFGLWCSDFVSEESWHGVSASLIGLKASAWGCKAKGSRSFGFRVLGFGASAVYGFWGRASGIKVQSAGNPGMAICIGILG